MLFGFNSNKCKTQCKLGVGRIKLLRNKKQLAMKGLRKEVAELMRQNKQGNARIRVEAVMREHRMLQAFEILELYLELLAVRAELLSKTKELPPDMVEAIDSLIYAGERVSTDLLEINAVAKMLVAKYTPVYKESGFPHEVVSDLTCRKWQVNDDLVTCLAVTAPNPEEKLAFLQNIAEEYGVEFDRDAAAMDMLPAPRPAAAEGVVPPTPTYPTVGTLMADGPVTFTPPGGTPTAAAGVPPLAQGWQPPAAAPPPHPAAQQQPGWQPPGAAGGEAGKPGVARLFSGDMFVRPGPAAEPGPTELPSARQQGGGEEAQGWRPPAPEDFNQKGRSFVRHVDAAAAWRNTKMHGAASGESSLSQDGPGKAAASGAGGTGGGVAAQWDQLRQQGGGGGPPAHPALGHRGSDASVTGPMAVPGAEGSTAHSSGGSTPSLGDKPLTPGSSYADASAAAEAAKKYSQMAVQAARRAEEFAASQAAGKKGGLPGGASPGDDESPGGSGAASPGGGGGGGGGQQFVPRSLSEIKAAYDAAPGPPTKPKPWAADATAPGPPSAPPAPGDAAGSSSVTFGSGAAAAGMPPAPAGGAEGAAGDGDVPALPSVPTAGAPPPPAVQDELDELTKRFEMLKRR